MAIVEYPDGTLLEMPAGQLIGEFERPGDHAERPDLPPHEFGIAVGDEYFRLGDRVAIDSPVWIGRIAIIHPDEREVSVALRPIGDPFGKAKLRYAMVRISADRLQQI